MKALLLAGGYGTRLGTLTRSTAKPLLLVAGQPILTHILAKVEKVDEVDATIVVTNAKFCSDFFDWRTTVKPRKPLIILNDGTFDNLLRLGAVGDIQFALKACGNDDDMLIIGGDNLFDLDLCEFVHFFHNHGTAIAIYDHPENELVRGRYGVVEMDDDGCITNFVEKSPNPPTTLVAICVYLVSHQHLPLIETYLKNGGSRDVPGSFFEWLAKRKTVYGFRFEGRWFDIGDPASLAAAQAAYRRER
jgi:glucose-1-phosphate thymidylyltransferase